LVELLEQAGSFEYAKLLVSNHVERALDHIESLPDSEEKEMLTEIALISESRTN
jgi:geranylgeranyl pyrophosphate synthase